MPKRAGTTHRMPPASPTPGNSRDGYGYAWASIRIFLVTYLSLIFSYFIFFLCDLFHSFWFEFDLIHRPVPHCTTLRHTSMHARISRELHEILGLGDNNTGMGQGVDHTNNNKPLSPLRRIASMAAKHSAVMNGMHGTTHTNNNHNNNNNHHNQHQSTNAGHYSNLDTKMSDGHGNNRPSSSRPSSASASRRSGKATTTTTTTTIPSITTSTGTTKPRPRSANAHRTTTHITTNTTTMGTGNSTMNNNNVMDRGRGNIMTMGSPWRDDIDVGYSHRTGLGVGLGGEGGLGGGKGPPPMINHNNTSLRPSSSGGFYLTLLNPYQSTYHIIVIMIGPYPVHTRYYVNLMIFLSYFTRHTESMTAPNNTLFLINLSFYVCLSLRLSFPLSVCLSVCLSSLCLSICLSISLSVLPLSCGLPLTHRLSVCLSVQ